MRRRTWLIGCLASALLAAPAPAQEAAKARRPPELWAVVVGVDDPSRPDDRSATRASDATYRWFIGPGGWDRSHVLLLNELGNRDPGPVNAPRASLLPIKANLDWAFRVWLKAKAQPGDTIVFAYSGRSLGVIRPEGEHNTPVARYYLLPKDASAINLKATGWRLDEAIDEFAAQGDYRVVCWLGTAMLDLNRGAPGAAASKAKGPKPTGAGWLRTLTRWPGVTAWLAADDVAPEQAAEAAGRFQSALLRGLGTPDRPRNLVACLQDLRDRPELRAQGFAAVGGVAPDLTLWFKDFGRPRAPELPEMVLQVGHADQVTGIVPTADGRRMVSASMDSTVRVWSIADRALLRILPEAMVGASGLASSHDGKWLVFGDGLGRVFVRDAARDFAPRLIPRQPHRAPVTLVAMLPDGAHFVTVDRDARSFLWDLARSPLAPTPWLEKAEVLDVAAGDGLVAATIGDGTVRLFGPDGAPRSSFPAPNGPPTALAVAPDGERLAIGFKDGRLLVREAANGRMTERERAPGAVDRLAFARSGRLAIGHAKGVTLLDNEGRSAALWDRAPGRLLFATDGRYLAASDADTGAVRVWRVDGRAPTLVLGDDGAKAATLAFRGDGRALIAGGFDGSIRTRPLEPIGPDLDWPISAHRGKVQHLAAAASRAHLLAIDESGRALTWDLKERRVRPLPGAWTSGLFVKEGDKEELILTVDPQSEANPGALVLVDPESQALLATFARASGPFQVPEGLAFVGLTASPDGAKVAATADPSQPPLVCVWDVKSRRLTHWLDRLDDPARTLSFSPDGRFLLTAGDAPEARLWDLDGPAGARAAPAVVFNDPEAHHVTRALIRPDVPGQLVTGHSDGRLSLWSWRDGKAKREVANLLPGVFATSIKAIAFSVIEKECYLAAAGDSKTIWFGRMGTPPRRLAEFGPGPHHFEQVNALVAWPGTSLLASGSDDTTIRFWDLAKKAPWGAFSTATPAAPGPQNEAAGALDWVLYTPDGRFDASPTGRALVRFRHRDEARAMEQFDVPLDAIERADREGRGDPLSDSLYTFELSELLREGRSPKVASSQAEPPRLSLEPPTQPDPDKPDALLTLALGSADLRDVRLYQNGVPVAIGPEEGRAPGSTRLEVPVRLLKGINRFYAMASRSGAPDGRSGEIELTYNGETEPGLLHIVALGVGDYERERLNFARRDARRIGDVLHQRGLDSAGKPGMRIVLTDDQVTPEGVSGAFRALAKRVKGNPQDTVVVFLAGHTGVMDERLFCLLLKSFPFPKESPRLASARGSGAFPDKLGGIDRRHILPYYVLAQHLTRLDALKRLVIVDACQAGAITEDPRVVAIQKWMEIGSRPARTSYLMAARRGEPALEAEPIGHGLFTFTLLRGMGALARNEIPPDVARLALPESADANGDAILTTGELDQYVNRALPPLALQFPKWAMAARQAVVSPDKEKAAPSEPDLEQRARLQSANVSFRLFTLPAPEVKKVAGAEASRSE